MSPVKITVGVTNMAMYPENDAEVYQLEGLKKQLDNLAIVNEEIRHWDIVCLKVPLKDKTHESR